MLNQIRRYLRKVLKNSNLRYEAAVQAETCRVLKQWRLTTIEERAVNLVEQTSISDPRIRRRLYRLNSIRKMRLVLRSLGAA